MGGENVGNVKYGDYLKAINQVLSGYPDIRLTVRQIYYRLVSAPFRLIPNTRSSYSSFDQILIKARECGDIDWTRIEDRSREVMENSDLFWYSSPEEFVEGMVETLRGSWSNYSKPMWETQSIFPVIVVEKDALSAFFKDVANGYRVIVFPSRGYSSFTKVKELIDVFDNYPDHEKIILHFSDHDPSGLDMTKDWKIRLAKYGELSDIEVKRIALNIDQVKAYQLAPNPVKMADPRAKSYVSQYGQECWELDAVPPNQLQRMIREAIEDNIDLEEWNKRIEDIEAERNKAKGLLETLLRKPGLDSP
jgi:hypothetical protein